LIIKDYIQDISKTALIDQKLVKDDPEAIPFSKKGLRQELSLEIAIILEIQHVKFVLTM
jgi:hypothetical protein